MRRNLFGAVKLVAKLGEDEKEEEEKDADSNVIASLVFL